MLGNLRALCVGLAVLAFSAPLAAQVPGSAPPNRNPEVEAVIQHHVQALNSADLNAIASDWADNGVLVDAFPPFVWMGPKSYVKWWSDLQATLKAFKLNKVVFSLGDWQRVFVAGDDAYVVVAASCIVSGPDVVTNPKGIWTFTLHRVNSAWKITSWNWGGPPAKPIKQKPE